MGMTLTLYRVTAAGIDRVLTNPDRAREIIDADAENWIIERPKGIVGFLLRFTPMSVETARPKEPLTDADLERLDENECDLDKAWQGLHFLLTGTAWKGEEPACYLLQGGEDVGDDEFDTPPRLLQPDQVSNFSRLLSSLSESELRARYDPYQMMALGIYPEIWQPEDTSDFEYLLGVFGQLQPFVEKAAEAGDGLLIHLG